MIDDLERTNFLLEKLKTAVPIEARLSQSLIRLFGGKVSGDAYSGKVQRSRRILYWRRRRHNLLPSYIKKCVHPFG